jgi:hypothetical protein
VRHWEDSPCVLQSAAEERTGGLDVPNEVLSIDLQLATTYPKAKRAWRSTRALSSKAGNKCRHCGVGRSVAIASMIE